MAPARHAALAVLFAVVLASASATYVTKKPTTTKAPATKAPTVTKRKCYARGERSIGAPGKPAVPYFPCCDGAEPRPKKNDIYYDPSKDWGLFCGGTGNFVVTKNCHDAGVKAIGAPGYPYVEYKPCCSGVSPREKKGNEIKKENDKWGQFCMDGASPGATKEPVKPVVDTGKIRCAGAPGYPYVEYVFCGPNKKCAESPKDGWGSFCLPKTSKDCVAAGDRNEGATGYPNVPYLPCCSGKQNVPVKGTWGKFCPADGKPKDVIIVTNPPTVAKPRQPVYPTQAPQTTKKQPPRTTKKTDPTPMPSPDYEPYVPPQQYY